MPVPSGLEKRIPAWAGEDSWLHVQYHAPLPMAESHWHNHIEINYLHTCSMVYECGSQRIVAPQGRIVVFWASIPHRVSEVHGNGRLTCLNVPLQEFWRWRLPTRFRHEVMHGGFLVTLDRDDSDRATFARWRADFDRREPAFRRQILDEIHLRLRRMALTGWQLANAGRASTPRSGYGALTRPLANAEAMASYIAEHYDDAIGVTEVAGHVGLHPNYAMSLFKQAVGISISAYLTRHRLSHAQAMLLDSNDTVASIALDCGFGSLSRFYEAFRTHLRSTPSAYRKARAVR